MPTVTIDGDTIDCPSGMRLRSALLGAGRSPHNQSHLLSCQGIGSCGTCAVEVVAGDAGPVTKMEHWRLAFPPHRLGAVPMRLACQVRVHHDLEVRKWPGLWGPLPTPGATDDARASHTAPTADSR